MSAQPLRLVTLFLPTVLLGALGCGPTDASAPPHEAAASAERRVHPDSLGEWVLPASSTTRALVAYRLEDLGIGPERFGSLRARYLQTVYGTDAQVSTRVLATIQIDQAVQSGAWDGTYPAEISGLREPGLIVDWQIQNSIYNAFDRVLTDQHLGMRQRLMPGGSSVAGLVMGAVDGGVHTRLVADPTAPADGPGGTEEAVIRTPLGQATVNVLTGPLVMSQMDLAAGDVFTLPGYALIGGPEGVGTRWLGVYEVLSVENQSGGGVSRRRVELLAATRPADWTGPSDIRTREGRFTRMILTDTAPYLLAREDYQMDADGTILPTREHLHLVDWAPLPLPSADLVPDSLWRVQLESQLFNLEPSLLPRIVRPGR